MPTSSPTPVAPAADDLFGGFDVLGWAIANIWITLGVLAVLIFGINYGIKKGWSYLTLQANAKGEPLAPLGDILRRARSVMFKEDNNPVFLKNQALAQRFAWLTWKRYWTIITVLNVVAFVALVLLRNVFALGFFGACVIAFALGIGRLRKIFTYRHWVLMQMFQVAATQMRYENGSQLNPWGYVQITEWHELNNPGTTIVRYKAKYRADNENIQKAFEAHFNGAISDQHTWNYTWEPAQTRVVCEPTPLITDRAEYPFPDMHPWNEFPLGISEGGQEAVWTISVHPHALVAGTTGSGKLLTLDTPIPTPSGWTMMGQLKVGDTVFDETGKPCRITDVSDVNEQPDLYEVTFSDGSTIEADAEHLWWTETRQARESRWNARRKVAARRPLVAPNRAAELRALADQAKLDDEITLAHVAEVAGVHPGTPWLRALAAELGHTGEVQKVLTFSYAEQTVPSTRMVRVFPAQESWSALASRASERKNLRHLDVQRLGALASGAKSGDTVTASAVARELGFKSSSQAVRTMAILGVPSTWSEETVSRMVPARTVQRPANWVRTYPARALLLRVAECSDRFAFDGRHRATTGGVRTTREILETLRVAGGQANHCVPVAKPLDLPEKDLPIDPYLLGVWLGDGVSRSGRFCGVDSEIAATLTSRGHALVEGSPEKGDRNADYRVWKVEGLTGLLREAGLLQLTTSEGSQKSIPSEYLRSSVTQRADLLAGLLDTDGTVSPQGQVQFTNTNHALALGVFELAAGLGYRPVIREGRAKLNGAETGPKWTVSWTSGMSPFLLTRKNETHQARNGSFSSERNASRYIVSVKPVATKPGLCIQVDSPNRMFLAGRAMIPTHNSVTQRTILMHALQSPEWRIVLVDPKRVELSGYKDHPNVLKVATELDESVALIEQVEEEMQSRYRRMQEKGVNFFRNLDPHPPAIMLMVDETFALLSPTGIKSEEGKEQDAMKARIGIMLGSIARLGRAAGIHMILATQRPDAKVLPGEVKANLDARIAQGRMDNTPSLMTLDSDAATKIPPIKGRAVFRAGGEAPRMFQAYFLKEEELGMALQLAKSLALEELTPDMFLDKPEEEAEAPKRKLPKIKTPKLPQSGWFARWVEKRKALVEENERRSDKAVADRQLRRKGGADLPQVDRSEIEEEFLHAGQSAPHTSGADTSGMALFPAYATAQSTLFDPLPATPAAALPEIEEDLDDFADLDDLEPEVAPPAPQAPVAAPVAPTPDPAVPALSVEEVMQRASERGVAIPASELLAALRAEAARQTTPEALIEEPAAVEASEEPTPSAAPAAGVPRRPQLPGAPAAAAPAAPQAPSAAPGALGLPPLPPRRQR